jgi:hypothetical protein
MNELVHHILGALDMIAAFTMIWANQRITMIAGVRTVQARWALYRRAVYLLMAVALFVLGVKRFFDDADDVTAAIAQGSLLVGIMFFPLMRAVGLITQDMLADWIRSDRYR